MILLLVCATLAGIGMLLMLCAFLFCRKRCKAYRSAQGDVAERYEAIEDACEE